MVSAGTLAPYVYQAKAFISITEAEMMRVPILNGLLLLLLKIIGTYEHDLSPEAIDRATFKYISFK